MGTDKLNMTARAAGFAMACDEIPAAPPAQAAAPVAAALWVAKPHNTAQHSTALVPVKQPKISLGWNMVGWGFWKTA